MIDVESVTFGHGARVSISIPEPKCLTVLDALIKATRADFGNVQLFNTENGSLEIVAQRGFSGEFLEYFSSVHENQAACGTAMGSGMPVLVDDVLTSSIFAENGLQKVMANAHVRAVYSTPLIGRDRSILGMASIHFRAAQRPSADELRIADALARQLSARVEDFSRRPQPSKVARKIVSPSTRRLRSRALRFRPGRGKRRLMVDPCAPGMS